MSICQKCSIGFKSRDSVGHDNTWLFSAEKNSTRFLHASVHSRAEEQDFQISLFFCSARTNSRFRNNSFFPYAVKNPWNEWTLNWNEISSKIYRNPSPRHQYDKPLVSFDFFNDLSGFATPSVFLRQVGNQSIDQKSVRLFSFLTNMLVFRLFQFLFAICWIYYCKFNDTSNFRIVTNCQMS